MKPYRIESTGSGLHIAIDGDKTKQPAILESLEECRTGRCSCPTPEYDKIAEMDVSTHENSVEIHLQTKPGEALEPARIEACLEHTISRGKPR